MDAALMVRLPVSRKAPALARRALEALDGELEGVRDPACLLVSELVTNSVRHAGLDPGDKIELEVASSETGVRIEVADRGPRFEPRRDPLPADARSGFGLHFVNELADRWGTDENGVWFELDRPGIAR